MERVIDGGGFSTGAGATGENKSMGGSFGSRRVGVGSSRVTAAQLLEEALNAGRRGGRSTPSLTTFLIPSQCSLNTSLIPPLNTFSKPSHYLLNTSTFSVPLNILSKYPLKTSSTLSQKLNQPLTPPSYYRPMIQPLQQGVGGISTERWQVGH